jgi:hypothetical protein
MKKLMIVSIMLMAAFAAQAQLKVAPKMEKGTTRTYATTMTANIPRQGEMKMTADTKYTVSGTTADGYTLDVVTTDVTSDASAGNIAGKLIAASQELMKGMTVSLATDKDGKIVKIMNFNELKPKMDAAAGQLVDQLLKDVPQLSQLMSREVLIARITDNVTEENLVRTMQANTSVLTLNGKTIMTGAQDDFVNEQGVKMKRMYFVNGKKVTTSSSMNMSKDEMKAFIIKHVEQMAPSQAEMIKQNIDQVIATGLLKIEMKETADYEVGDDGWVRTLKSEATTDAMGQKTTITNVTTLK